MSSFPFKGVLCFSSRCVSVQASTLVKSALYQKKNKNKIREAEKKGV